MEKTLLFALGTLIFYFAILTSAHSGGDDNMPVECEENSGTGPSANPQELEENDSDETKKAPTVLRTTANCTSAELPKDCSYKDIMEKFCTTLGFEKSIGLYIENPYADPNKPVSKLISCTN